MLGCQSSPLLPDEPSTSQVNSRSLDTLSQYEPLSRDYVPLHEECCEFMGASTSGLLRVTVVPSKVPMIPDTVPIPKVPIVPDDFASSRGCVFEAGSDDVLSARTAFEPCDGL